MAPEWGNDRVAVRIGPSGTFGGMHDSDPVALFTHVARELDALGIAYLHLIEPRVLGNVMDETKDQAPVASRLIRQHFHGLIIGAGGFTPESAEATIAEGSVDLVAFGRFFISNPDLPERIRNGWPLSAYDRDSFFGGDARLAKTQSAATMAGDDTLGWRGKQGRALARSCMATAA